MGIDAFVVQDINEKIKEKDKKQDMMNHVCHRTITNIPNEVRKTNFWMLSNENKIPVDKNGYNKSAMDSDNYLSFDEMVMNNEAKNYYTVCLNNEFLIIDLDNCFEDGKLQKWGQDILNEFKHMNIYVEYSLSGTGLHIIFKATKSFHDMKNIGVKLKNTHEKFKNLNGKAGIDIFVKNHPCILTGNEYDYDCSFDKDKKIASTNKEVKAFIERIKTLSNKNRKTIKRNYERKLEEDTTEVFDIFELIKATVPIESLLEKYNIDLGSGNINCILPDHDDNTPSMKVYDFDDTWFCFGCNVGGSVIDLVMHKERCNSYEAAKKLNEMFNLDIDFSSFKNVDEEWFIVDLEGKIELDHIKLRDHIHEEHHVYLTEVGWHIFKDGYFQNVDKQELLLLIEQHMIDKKHNKFKKTLYVDEVYKMLKRYKIKYTQFNHRPLVINLKNKMFEYNRQTKSFEELKHDANYMLTYQLGVEHHENSTCERWQKFLNDALPEDQQKLLQELIGYTLIRSNRAKKLFCLYGVGDSGKSLILDVIGRLVGETNTSAIPLQTLTSNNSRFATFSLRNSLVNMCGDISANALHDTAIVKQLTGDDMICFEAKGKDAVFDRNYATLIYSMNKKPKLYDKSAEFLKRVIIIPFLVACPIEKQDWDLINKFNMEGILNWALEGLTRLINNNFRFSESKANRDMIEEYTNEESAGADFASSCLELSNDKTDCIMQTELMDAYKYFCRVILSNNYSDKLTANNLVHDITTRYTSVKKSKNIFNPKTQTNSARGLRYVKFKEDFKKEFEQYSGM